MQKTTPAGELLETCKQAVDAALRSGADQAEVYATDLLDLEIGLQKNDLDQVASARESTFGIRVISDHRQGFATTNRPQALAETAAEALTLARIAPSDPLRDLPDPQEFGPTTDCVDPSFDGIETQPMVALAMSLLRQTLAQDSRLTVDTAELSFSRSTNAIASSKGIARSWTGTAGGGSIFGMAVDGNEVGSFAYDGARVRSLEGLEETLSIAFARFARKALGALGAHNGVSFRGPILLPPECVAEFLVPKIVHAASAKTVRQGGSPLTGKIGQSIAMNKLSLIEAGPGLDLYPLCPFDREGLSRAALPIMTDGVLKNLLTDSYEARVMGQSPTAHALGGASSLPMIGAGAIEVLAGSTALSTLKEMDRGLIVTRFSGSSDIASGEFSGVVKGGFLVEHGEIRPIRETTIAGNIWTSLLQISGISTERENFYGTQTMPWIRIEDISVTAGQSDRTG